MVLIVGGIVLKWSVRRRRRRRWLLLLAAALLLAVVVFLDRQLLPLLTQYSKTQAQWRVTRMINEAVTEVLGNSETDYGALVTVTRDSAGNVVSAEADTRRLNMLKAAVTTAVTERIGAEEEMTVAIPVGTLLGSGYFAGRGPFVRIPVGVSGGVLTTVDSVFTAAGVNQTTHRIEMKITVDLFIAVPTAHTSVRVETPFIIAESVLLGKVPDAYTVVTGDDQSTTGQIFDYGAERLQK